VLPGSERWALALLRPGEHPLARSRQATADIAPGGRLVLAVDQFEEAFTTCRDEAERAAFVDALIALLARPASACTGAGRRPRRLLRPLRRLSRAVAPAGANQIPVGPMRRDELRRAIELPARRAGLRVEPDLTDALIGDVEGEPGALPLLSTSLLELWAAPRRPHAAP